MFDINAETFATKNCIHTIIQVRKSKKLVL